MTDKQIIIDGCDVSGCDCYCDGKCLCEYNEINRKIIRYYSCNKFPNCYYKQLKRAEQRIVELNKTIQTKEQECEELKKQVCGLRPELKYIIDKTCCKYNINAKYYHEKIIEIINNLDKYTQTLTEIKEIAKNGCYDDCGMPLDELSIILQKISECEGNDE